nr:MAG: capsid protein [Cressdnaviricota sp.]
MFRKSYGKRFSKKSSYRRRSSPTKYRSKRYPVRKAIVSIARKVKAIEQHTELKTSAGIIDSFGNAFANYTYSGTPLTTTLTNTVPQLFFASGLQKGTDVNQRIGEKIQSTSIHFTGQIYPNVASNFGIDYLIRIMVIRQTTPRGNAMQLYFDNTTLAGNPNIIGVFNCATGKYPSSFSQPDTQNSFFEDYKILYDHKHRLHNQVGTQSGSVKPFMNFNIKIPTHSVIDYTRGNTGTWTDIEKNSYWIAFISDAGSDIATVELDCYHYFKDS